MRKFIIYINLILMSGGYLNSIAQDSSIYHKEPPKENPRDRVFLGGWLGIQVFRGNTLIDISPLIGYRFTNRIIGGVGLTYQYYHYDDGYYNIETNNYGGRIFGRYLFTPNLFGHLEYEYLNLEAYDSNPTRRVGVTGILAGGGYTQSIGGRGGIFMMILYNFTESYYTPYANPVIRIGAMFGI